MIAELGLFSLLLALALSVFLAGGLVHAPLLPVARRGMIAVFSLLTLSFAALMACYVVSDFSVLNVVKNSHRLKPLLYKITGVWGNHEGSMLLWVWVMAGWGAALAWAGNSGIDKTFRRRALAVLAAMLAGFLSFIAFTSNPFARVTPPAPEGMDLNPLLQDVALALHPPLLYMGYVGFSVVFAFAAAALIEGRVDTSFARVVRPWALAAWGSLTGGIALGSVWAYYELGWGGFWFWDPVENVSLLPWLTGGALVHCLAAMARGRALPHWTAILSILTFGFSLLGTFLVRSGVLTSVHAFAADPARGLFILLLLTLALGGAFALYALRAPQLSARGTAVLSPAAREGVIVINNIFLFTAAVTVAIGTLYPVLLTAIDAPGIAVGTPYYRAVLLPMLVPFALLMGIAPLTAWHGTAAQLGKAVARAGIPLALALVFAVLFARGVTATILMAGGLWIAAGTAHDLWRGTGQFRDIRRLTRDRAAMIAAHLGFALMLAGAGIVTGYSTEAIRWMKPGDVIAAGGYEITLIGTDMALGDNYTADRLLLAARRVRKLPKPVILSPERRFYPRAQQETSETALLLAFPHVIYTVRGDSDPRDMTRVVVKVFYHPWVSLIYIGAALMMLGALLPLAGRRKA